MEKNSSMIPFCINEKVVEIDMSGVTTISEVRCALIKHLGAYSVELVTAAGVAVENSAPLCTITIQSREDPCACQYMVPVFYLRRNM